MFFEAFGKVMCNEVSPELIDYKFPQNYKFSVNEILKHNEEFAKTYGCPFGFDQSNVYTSPQLFLSLFAFLQTGLTQCNPSCPAANSQ
ncbi:unnamed protein product [Schistosoma turkestanicum]|nr:unnamed protein product [Schistosoma turkestanicum]